ncbi:MAG: lysophospholipid acyltransferase family protein [Terriglobia bacterium]
MIRAFLAISLAVVLIVFLGTPLLVYCLLSRETDTMYGVGIWACRTVLRVAGIRVQTAGGEKIPTGRAVVFMPNHQSNCDPPALLTVLPPVLVMAKKGLFAVPILGHAMRLRGFVPVDRQNRERAMQAIEEGARAVAAGHSFMIYPEGKRTSDGRLLPFKRGAFVLAIKGRAPIVPISISGAHKIMPKGSFAIRPGVMRVTFHDPIPTTQYSLDDRDELSDVVRRAILRGLAPEEQPKSPQGG